MTVPVRPFPAKQWITTTLSMSPAVRRNSTFEEIVNLPANSKESVQRRRMVILPSKLVEHHMEFRVVVLLPAKIEDEVMVIVKLLQELGNLQ